MLPPASDITPANARGGTHFRRLSDELVFAWDHTDASLTRQWARKTAGFLGTSLKRRASNLLSLAGRLAGGTVRESAECLRAFNEERLAHHLNSRGAAVYVEGTELVARARVVASQTAQIVRHRPREAIPQLLMLVATSLLVSGGPDGDGGAPDLDLAFGIGAHRSILTHSILMGAALETAFLSLVELVKLVHANLPVEHDPLWDGIAHHAEAIATAATTGASLGLSYHLLVDGLIQPAAYHDLPVSMPLEAHQSVFVANSVAEALDVQHKPRPPGALRGGEVRSGRTESLRGAPTPPGWRATASPADIEAQRSAHRRLLTQAYPVDAFIVGLLAEEELFIVQRYGVWLEALASGNVLPLTNAQEQFVLVAQGKQRASTAHEQAWVVYQSLVAFAPAAHARP